MIWPMVVSWFHARPTLVRTVGWQVRPVGFQFQLVKTEPELGLIFGTQFRVGIRFIAHPVHSTIGKTSWGFLLQQFGENGQATHSSIAPTQKHN